MTVVGEAIALPIMFLTVVLAAAIRPGATVSVAPPSLAALVAGVALIALLVRSGVVLPGRLMNHQRSLLANLNGFTVLFTTFCASAQLFTALVPESGVPALLVWAVLTCLVLQAFALGPDRTQLLRGLLVMVGAAFVLKFSVLAAISSPAEGRAAKAVQRLFEGVTLGAVTQRPPHPAEGYLTFAAGALYLIAISLLPSAPWRMIRVSQRSVPASALESRGRNAREMQK
jgi:hypothetical protein